jgi:putative ABC transport system permease protein
MGPVTVVSEAFMSLWRNKVRTGLSILGVVIGIAAVIAMVAVGTGAQEAVEREIAAMGDDWVVVWYSRTRASGAQTREQRLGPNTARDDVAAILDECTAVRAISLSSRQWRATQAVCSFGNHRTTVRGVEPSYFNIRRWNIIRGRGMTTNDIDLREKVIWLGDTVATELFGSMDPIGQQVRLGRGSFEVVGLLEPKGAGADGEDYDDEILMPLSTYRVAMGRNDPPRVFFAGTSPGASLALAKDQIRQVLRQRHRLRDDEPDNFRMFDRAETAEARENVTRQMNFLLTAIASISLLVGGIGIMNIMLVSVTERTREIGLRMAIGANSRHILGQFLTEAIVLCAVGGSLGFLGGWVIAMLAEEYGQQQAVISYWMAAVAIGFSSIIGIFFGFYPAWRASQLDPIEALRHE